MVSEGQFSKHPTGRAASSQVVALICYPLLIERGCEIRGRPLKRHHRRETIGSQPLQGRRSELSLLIFEEALRGPPKCIPAARWPPSAYLQAGTPGHRLPCDLEKIPFQEHVSSGRTCWAATGNGTVGGGRSAASPTSLTARERGLQRSRTLLGGAGDAWRGLPLSHQLHAWPSLCKSSLKDCVPLPMLVAIFGRAEPGQALSCWQRKSLLPTHPAARQEWGQRAPFAWQTVIAYQEGKQCPDLCPPQLGAVLTWDFFAVPGSCL